MARVSVDQTDSPVTTQAVTPTPTPQTPPPVTPAPQQEESSYPGVASEDKEANVITSADIVTVTARNLYKLASTSYIPFFLPPTEIIIDELKVSIVDKSFLSEQVRTFLVKDINDVILDTNFMFATLKIVSGEYKEQLAPPPDGDPDKAIGGPYTIKYLPMQAAAKARRIILGLKILGGQKQNTAAMSVEEVAQTAEELGRAR